MIAAAELVALTSGWSGLGLGFGLVEAAVLGGLFWGGGGDSARLRKLLRSPFIAVGAMAAAGAAMSLAKPLILGLGIASGGVGHLGIALAANAALGFMAGRMLARADMSGNRSIYLRGTRLLNKEETKAKQRSQERRVER